MWGKRMKKYRIKLSLLDGDHEESSLNMPKNMYNRKELMKTLEEFENRMLGR